jgi:hypothetical protein
MLEREWWTCEDHNRCSVSLIGALSGALRGLYRFFIGLQADGRISVRSPRRFSMSRQTMLPRSAPRRTEALHTRVPKSRRVRTGGGHSLTHCPSNPAQAT